VIGTSRKRQVPIFQAFPFHAKIHHLQTNKQTNKQTKNPYPFTNLTPKEKFKVTVSTSLRAIMRHFQFGSYFSKTSLA